MVCRKRVGSIDLKEGIARRGAEILDRDGVVGSSKSESTNLTTTRTGNSGEVDTACDGQHETGCQEHDGDGMLKPFKNKRLG